ncbi:MAG: acetylxylan esterase [Anaerolineae bacterium]
MTFQNPAPSPVPSELDLRDMLRQHIMARGLAAMEAAAARRDAALTNGEIPAYRSAIREAVRGFYGTLPVGDDSAPVDATPVSHFDKDGYRLENVLFESFPGWQVNATVYVPLDYEPPFPAVVIGVGHSGKQFESYQLPAQLFARSGYLAVVFDPPGQASEKQPGNDHFRDGVRCYLVGETSSRYFVADALRCIDYLETREDVDLSRGVAMTGVSGGGTTTTLATLLDDRITVAGPSCCVTPLADLDITQCYAGCPETHMWERYAKGIDEVDLLCAAVPKPLLLMAGRRDEVFHIEDTQRLARQVQRFYDESGYAARFEFFVDQGGHGYTLAQARRFVRFMNRWLLKQPDRPQPDLPDETFALDPYAELQCHPRLDVNMRSLALDRARELAATRDRDARRIRSAARTMAGIDSTVPAPEAVAGKPFQVWTHNWQQLLLRPEPGIELPATMLSPVAERSAALLHLDDRHRTRLLYRNGPLARAVDFLQRDRPGFAALTVDLRGWGDTAPAMYPYEMASWGGIDRYLAYATAALGDPVLSMRIRDALAALAYLRTRPEVVPEAVVVSGCGLAGIVALHVAAIDGDVRGAVVWDCPVSFQALLEAEDPIWPAETFWPNVLLHYDLPELVAALPCPVRVLNPLDGTGAPLSDEAIAELDRSLASAVYAAPEDDRDLAQVVGEMLSG